ncbi:MAG: NADH-quinone oxidoreductase subunit NuoN [Ahniella sp.]|nr:NADH-quinone oxidoreductase subunit NuoN [Ahniella sp.]
MLDFWAILPEAFLTLSACILLIADLFIPRERKSATHWLSILVLVITAVLVWRNGQDPTLYGNAFSGLFVRDGVATLAKFFILISSALVLVYAKPHLEMRGLMQGEYYLLILFSVLGMMLMASSGSMLTIYLGLELLALCSYALVAMDRDNKLSSEAGMKYFVLGAMASGLLLYGMSMVYGATGELELSGIRGAINSNMQHPNLVLFGLVFIVIGIAFKFGAAPFHMWVPDVYQGAPTSVAMFIGSAPKIAAFAMAYRLLDSALGNASHHWSDMLSVLAVLSLVLGNLIAVAQTNFKRMLAYSTVSHVGFLLLGLIGGGVDGFAAALFYSVTYALTAAASFGVIVLMSRSGFEAENIEDFSGLNERNGWYAFLVLLIMASLAGVPMFVGFLAKLEVLKAAVQGGSLWLALIAGVCAVIGAFYYLRVIKVVYFDEPKTKEVLVAPDDVVFRTVLGLNALALVALGLFGGPLISWCQRAVAGI